MISNRDFRTGGPGNLKLTNSCIAKRGENGGVFKWGVRGNYKKRVDAGKNKKAAEKGGLMAKSKHSRDFRSGSKSCARNSVADTQI